MEMIVELPLEIPCKTEISGVKASCDRNTLGGTMQKLQSFRARLKLLLENVAVFNSLHKILKIMCIVKLVALIGDYVDKRGALILKRDGRYVPKIAQDRRILEFETDEWICKNLLEKNRDWRTKTVKDVTTPRVQQSVHQVIHGRSHHCWTWKTWRCSDRERCVLFFVLSQDRTRIQKAIKIKGKIQYVWHAD